MREDMGNGFQHHGVTVPVSNHRGTVATVDGDGRNVVLVWLYDHRGGYALLMVDAQTGGTEQFPMPYDWGGDGPFASVLSSANRYYTHFGSHFCEFDPVQRAFTFHHETVPQMAMSMTEADDGVIWSATYPNSAVASYNPGTGEFRDFGNLYDQPWRQYPRSIAVDDTGWVYFGIGSTSGQIIILDPATGEARPMLAEDERAQGAGYVYRDMDGKVYGQAVQGEGNDWWELYGGEARKIGAHETVNEKPIIADSQGLYHREFPNGELLVECDLVNRVLTIEVPATGETRLLDFDYVSEGAHLMGVCAAPDGTACGGTAFPMHFFSYDPTTSEMIDRPALSQWNTVTALGDRYFVGGYGHGVLLEWDPAAEWVPTERDDPSCNPLFLAECPPTINRPHDLLAHPDGKLVVLAGTPGYGYTGGGLMFWDRETRTATVIEHTEIVPDQSTMSMLPLPDGKLLCGTTVAPGTGGEQKATEACMYIMDIASKRIEWQETLFPGAQGYTDMIEAPSGLVYGVVDADEFFVFDPATREVIHRRSIADDPGSTSGGQGPRVFIRDPAGRTWLLLREGIALLEDESFEITKVAESSVGIAVGGDYLDGRIYFASGSHLYSWAVPAEE